MSVNNSLERAISGGFIGITLYRSEFYSSSSYSNFIYSFSSKKSSYSGGFTGLPSFGSFGSSISESNLIISVSKSPSYSGGFLGYASFVSYSFSDCRSLSNKMYGKKSGYLWGLVKGTSVKYYGTIFSNNLCNEKECKIGSILLSRSVILVIVFVSVLIGGNNKKITFFYLFLIFLHKKSTHCSNFCHCFGFNFLWNLLFVVFIFQKMLQSQKRNSEKKERAQGKHFERRLEHQKSLFLSGTSQLYQNISFMYEKV